jgi:hypothetical protein
VPETLAALIRRRRPELDPSEVIPTGLDGLADRIRAFVEVGASKFVVLPVVEPDEWRPALDELASAVLPLQN